MEVFNLVDYLRGQPDEYPLRRDWNDIIADINLPEEDTGFDVIQYYIPVFYVRGKGTLGIRCESKKDSVDTTLQTHKMEIIDTNPYSYTTTIATRYWFDIYQKFYKQICEVLGKCSRVRNLPPRADMKFEINLELARVVDNVAKGKYKPEYTVTLGNTDKSCIIKGTAKKNRIGMATKGISENGLYYYFLTDMDFKIPTWSKTATIKDLFSCQTEPVPLYIDDSLQGDPVVNSSNLLCILDHELFEEGFEDLGYPFPKVTT